MNVIVLAVLLLIAYTVGKHSGKKQGMSDAAKIVSLEQVAAVKRQAAPERVEGITDAEVAIRNELTQM